MRGDMEDNIQNTKGYTLDNIYDRTDIRVVGWADYDSDKYESEPITDEVFFAVAREVKDKEYLFGGDAHQDKSDCAPILSTGRMARFSTRNWGMVIAIAYDERLPDGKYNYMLGYMDELIGAAVLEVDFAEPAERGDLGEAGFFGNLADGRGLGGLAGLDVALGDGPAVLGILD